MSFAQWIRSVEAIASAYEAGFWSGAFVSFTMGIFFGPIMRRLIRDCLKSSE